ncbi:MAG: hypothetical protein K5839_01450 [Treponemataceae bacterium]|nr:hypothetical protein [Treponemataceae bacterium]
MLEINKLVHHRLSSGDINPDLKEVYRYLGYSQKDLLSLDEADSKFDANTQQLIEESIKEMQPALKCQALYSVFDLEISGKKIKFADLEFESDSLSKNLKDCRKIVLLAATLGPSVDFLIKKYTKISPSKAAVMQACGAMYIEEYVGILNRLIKNEAESESFLARPRFSPGYGDLSLSIQKEFFRLLPCTQRLGLTLMESLIMAPEKSVTAFIGLQSN